uniref:Uncharacterized protein n=1 Tax=viral metagenome TaxID=1070528 RepID=A0A6M3IL37_9ZZZZ
MIKNDIIHWEAGARSDLFIHMKVKDMIKILQQFDPDILMYIHWEGQQKNLVEYNIFENQYGQVVINADTGYSPSELGAQDRLRIL